MGPNTSAYRSCSAMLNGELFVFGGNQSNTKQVWIYMEKWSSQIVHFRSARLSTVNWNVLVSSRMNFMQVLVEDFYLMVTNEWCSVSRKVIGINASGKYLEIPFYDFWRLKIFNFLTFWNMTSAAPLSVVLSLFSQRKERKKGRSGGLVWKGNKDYKTVKYNTCNLLKIKCNISVITAKTIRIIRIQLTIIIWLHSVILETKFLPLVDLQQIKLKYLISIQMHGRRKLNFLSAHLSETIIWLPLGSYVFSVYRYGVISRKSSVLIIGGRCDGDDSSLIAKYTIDKWEHVGNLQNSRHGHRAIANDDRIYVVGGYHDSTYGFSGL